MIGVKVIQTPEEIEKFTDIMADPERLGLSMKEIADLFHMSIDSIYTRFRSTDIQAIIRQKRTARIQIELPKVDSAMVRAALKGDTKAAMLIYERWDAYLPRTRHEIDATAPESDTEKKARLDTLKVFVQELPARLKKVEVEPIKDLAVAA